MRQRSAGQRWTRTKDETIHRHNLVRPQPHDAPLVQRFESSGEKAFSIRLTFLSSRPELARVLANAFWITYQVTPRPETVYAVLRVLRRFSEFLDYRAKSLPDVRTAHDLSSDLMKEFAVWLVATRRCKRITSAVIFQTCTSFLRKAKRLFGEEFNPLFSTPRHLFDGVGNEHTESRALPTARFKAILIAAEQDIAQIRGGYKPGDVPTSAQHLVPFMLVIAARTGVNAASLYSLHRDCLRPHEFDDDLFYCIWDKPRAHKQQRQLHRCDRRNQMGVVELIQFLQRYSEPLISQADPAEQRYLFLYLSQAASFKDHVVSSGSWSGTNFARSFVDFSKRHRLPRFTLSSIRPSAATHLYLETGGNVRKVQQFLQHTYLRTTVRYLLGSITESFNARVIHKAQERMIERVTVIAEQRATGVERLDLPKGLARKIVAGRFDTGCGTCRDPYDSPQPGEEKGQPCTSFHACFTCPNALWFLEDLPQVIATRERLVSLQTDMQRQDWDVVYGETVRVIDDNIIAAFRPEQIKAAAEIAQGQRQRPIVLAKGILA